MRRAYHEVTGYEAVGRRGSFDGSKGASKTKDGERGRGQEAVAEKREHVDHWSSYRRVKDSDGELASVLSKTGARCSYLYLARLEYSVVSLHCSSLPHADVSRRQRQVRVWGNRPAGDATGRTPLPLNNVDHYITRIYPRNRLAQSLITCLDRSTSSRQPYKAIKHQNPL